MPQTQKIQLAPITAWTLVKWFLIPGLILAYITLYPPHALDIALSEPFYNGTKFALNRIPVMVWIHRLFRIVPFFIGFSALFVIIQNLRNKVPPYKLGEVGNRRALYLILGMLASVFLVKFLKDTTGGLLPVRGGSVQRERAAAQPRTLLPQEPGSLLALWFHRHRVLLLRDVLRVPGCTPASRPREPHLHLGVRYRLQRDSGDAG